MKRLLSAVATLFFLVGCGNKPEPPLPPSPWVLTVNVDKDNVLVELKTDFGGSYSSFNTRTTQFSDIEWRDQGATITVSRYGKVVFSDRWITTGERTENISIPQEGRNGLVSLNNRVFEDADGLFNPLGATLFWAVWGEKNDPSKYKENLKSLKDAGVDYIRVLGEVGPAFWQDRTITKDDARQYLGSAIDRAYDEFGIRTQLTIFGAVNGTRGERDRFVNDVAIIVNERAHKVMLVEVMNEPFSIGGDYEELKAHARTLQGAIANVITVGAFGFEGPCPLYGGAPIDIASMHYDRTRPGGPWNAVRQPWGYPLEYERPECEIPPVAMSNEPIGPQSSVASDDSPLRMAMSYATVFVAGNAAYTFHSGPGIRGGGIEDINRARNANFWELPLWNEYVRGFQNVKKVLPVGLGNWVRENAQWVGFPFQGCDTAVSEGAITRCYAAHNGREFVVVMLGQSRPFLMTAKRSMRFDVIEPMSGTVVVTRELGNNESYMTDVLEGSILKGEWK